MTTHHFFFLFTFVLLGNLTADNNQLSPQEKSKINLSQEERQFLREKDKITYCIDPAWMPYEAINKDGKHIGMSADYLATISERLGVSFTLRRTSDWNESLIALQNKTCDFVPLMTPNADRESFVNFTSCYLNMETVIVTKPNQPSDDTVRNYLGKTYACIRGNAGSNELHEQFPDVKIREVDEVAAGLRLVKSGEVHGYIDLDSVITYTMQVEEIDGLKITAKLPNAGNGAFASRSDQPILNKILQKAVNSFTDEDHLRIKNKWLAITVKKVVDYTFIWKIIGVVSIIITTIFIWNRQLKNANRRIKTSLAAEREAVQQNLYFIDMISHEYRTPLSIINSCVDIISLHYDMTSHPELKEQTTLIQKSSQRLINLFNTSLTNHNLQGIEARESKLLHNIEAITKPTVENIKYLHPKHTFQVNIKDNNTTVYANSELLSTAISNILDNACKYSKEGSNVLLTGYKSDKTYVLTITDCGVGIKQKELNSIFDKYYRATTVTNVRGIGLGLFLVKRIIEIHSGTIQVESTWGKGTTFTVHLPVWQSKEAI